MKEKHNCNCPRDKDGIAWHTNECLGDCHTVKAEKQSGCCERCSGYGVDVAGFYDRCDNPVCECHTPEKQSGCRAKGNHSVDYYLPEQREEMKWLLDTICRMDADYEEYSPHIFHRELAEVIQHHYSPAPEKQSVVNKIKDAVDTFGAMTGLGPEKQSGYSELEKATDDAAYLLREIEDDRRYKIFMGIPVNEAFVKTFSKDGSIDFERLEREGITELCREALRVRSTTTSSPSPEKQNVAGWEERLNEEFFFGVPMEEMGTNQISEEKLRAFIARELDAAKRELTHSSGQASSSESNPTGQ